MVPKAAVILSGASLLTLLCLASCAHGIGVSQLDEACMFKSSDLIAPNDSPEAEAIYQRGRAHDINILSDAPDSIPTNLRGMKPDRAKARTYYAEAAEMGHVNAMNNLAVYEQNGWGFGSDHFPVNHKAAFRLNMEMARRGEATGYAVMGAYLINGMAGPRDPAKGEACLIEAAARGNVQGTLLLAELDLKLGGAGGTAKPDPRKVERSMTLLEDLGVRGESEAYEMLTAYYTHRAPDILKRERYALEAAVMGNGGGIIDLTTIYNPEQNIRPDDNHRLCLRSLTPAQYPDVERLCPRPDGPLSRADAGLPPKPKAPMDVRAYLDGFRLRHPDL